MLTREQLRAARAILGWTVRDLAPRAKVAPNTISRYENGADAMVDTLARIRRTFEAEGIEFPDPDTIRYAARRAGR